MSTEHTAAAEIEIEDDDLTRAEHWAAEAERLAWKHGLKVEWEYGHKYEMEDPDASPKVVDRGMDHGLNCWISIRRGDDETCWGAGAELPACGRGELARAETFESQDTDGEGVRPDDPGVGEVLSAALGAIKYRQWEDYSACWREYLGKFDVEIVRREWSNASEFRLHPTSAGRGDDADARDCLEGWLLDDRPLVQWLGSVYVAGSEADPETQANNEQQSALHCA